MTNHPKFTESHDSAARKSSYKSSTGSRITGGFSQPRGFALETKLHRLPLGVLVNLLVEARLNQLGLRGFEAHEPSDDWAIQRIETEITLREKALRVSGNAAKLKK